MTQTNDTPMRDASRDGSGGCLVCGKALPSRRARYCSRAHQQRAFRLRHQSEPARPAAPPPGAPAIAARWWRTPSTSARVAVNASSASVAAQTASLFSRAIGLGGHCPECDTPLLLVDLLGEEVVGTR